ncbi:MAG: dihydrofolate reductase [Cellvibrionales bacterium]|nr:dihydrofolate reductase [Cellvibrionales bacterium]
MARVAAIVAVAHNGVIGRDNQLPWHLPEDLKWFQQRTAGKPLIMGRKTFESFAGLLPGRPHVVVSSNPDYQHPGIQVAPSPQAALDLGQQIAAQSQVEEVIIAGGQTIYEQLLPQTERIYRTLIDLEPPGDTWFPPLSKDWLVEQQWPKSCNQVHFALQIMTKTGG